MSRIVPSARSSDPRTASVPRPVIALDTDTRAPLSTLSVSIPETVSRLPRAPELKDSESDPPDAYTPPATEAPLFTTAASELAVAAIARRPAAPREPPSRSERRTDDGEPDTLIAALRAPVPPVTAPETVKETAPRPVPSIRIASPTAATTDPPAATDTETPPAADWSTNIPSAFAPPTARTDVTPTVTAEAPVRFTTRTPSPSAPPAATDPEERIQTSPPPP